MSNMALDNDYRLLGSLIEWAPLDWLVIQTNPRCEQRAVMAMQAKGILGYCPMIPATRRVGRSKKKVDGSRPMFVRYVFAGVRRDKSSTDQILGCDGVESIVSFREDKSVHRVPAKQMMRIAEAALVAQREQKRVVGQVFEIGERVCITAGKWAWFRGEVEAIDKKKGQARVSLKLLGGDVPAAVPLDKMQSS